MASSTNLGIVWKWAEQNDHAKDKKILQVFILFAEVEEMDFKEIQLAS